MSDGTNSAAFTYLANSPPVSQITFRSNSATRNARSMPFYRFNASSMVAVAVLGACVFRALGEDPTLPLSNKKGTERTFDAGENAMLTAITNAFKDFKYRGMDLYEATKFRWDDMAPGWHPTNGFQLFPLRGPVTNVPLTRSHGVAVPYRPYFYIGLTSIGSNQTRVNVRTLLAEVDDGKEPGIHGGWAVRTRKVKPVRQEEQNVLDAIAVELLPRMATNVSEPRP